MSTSKMAHLHMCSIKYIYIVLFFSLFCHSHTFGQISVSYTLENGETFDPNKASGFVEFYPIGQKNNLANVNATKIVYYNTIYFNNLGVYIPKSSPIASTSTFLPRPFLELPLLSFPSSTVFFYHKLFDYKKNTMFQYRQSQIADWTQIIYKPLLMSSPSGAPFNYPTIKVFYSVTSPGSFQPLNLPFHLWVRSYQPDYTWNYPTLSPLSVASMSATSSTPIIYVPYNTVSINPSNVIYFSISYYNYDLSKISDLSKMNLAGKRFLHINDALYKPYQLRLNHILYEHVFYWPNQTEIEDFSNTFIPNKELAVYKPLILLINPSLTSLKLNYKNSFFNSTTYVTNGFQYNDPLQLLAQPYLNNIVIDKSTNTFTTTTTPTTTTSRPTTTTRTSTTTTPTTTSSTSTTTPRPTTTTTSTSTTTPRPTTTTSTSTTTPRPTTTTSTSTTTPRPTTTTSTSTTTPRPTTTTSTSTTTPRPTTTTSTSTTTPRPTTTTTKPTTTTTKRTTTTSRPPTRRRPVKAVTTTTRRTTTRRTTTRKPTTTTPKAAILVPFLDPRFNKNLRNVSPSPTTGFEISTTQNKITQPMILDENVSNYIESVKAFIQKLFR